MPSEYGQEIVELGRTMEVHAASGARMTPQAAELVEGVTSTVSLFDDATVALQGLKDTLSQLDDAFAGIGRGATTLEDAVTKLAGETEETVEVAERQLDGTTSGTALEALQAGAAAVMKFDYAQSKTAGVKSGFEQVRGKIRRLGEGLDEALALLGEIKDTAVGYGVVAVAAETDLQEGVGEATTSGVKLKKYGENK